MAFGFLKNVFESATSSFAKAKEPFSKAVSFFTENKFVARVSDVYHSWKESHDLYRNKPFLDQWSPDWKIPKHLVTPTRYFLKEQRQYMFRYTVKSDKDELIQEKWISFLSSDDLTIGEAQEQMDALLDEKGSREKYGEISQQSYEFMGVRQTKWLR